MRTIPIRAWRVVALVHTKSGRFVRAVTYYSRDEAMRARDTLIGFGVLDEKARIVALRDKAPPPLPEAEPTAQDVATCCDPSCIVNAHVECQCEVCDNDPEGRWYACADHTGTVSAYHEDDIKQPPVWRPTGVLT